MRKGKKKHGAQLFITKLNGQQVSGELLKVEGADLVLLLDSETGDKIPINEIKMIKLQKKSLSGTVFVVTWITSVALFGGGGHSGEEHGKGTLILLGIPVALVCGVAAGVMSEGYKTIGIEGDSPSQIDQVLAYLKTKARF